MPINSHDMTSSVNLRTYMSIDADSTGERLLRVSGHLTHVHACPKVHLFEKIRGGFARQPASP